MNTHNEIYLFLLGKSDKGLEIITNIFYKQLYSSFYISLKKNEEDLFMEFMVKLFEKRNDLLNKFENQDNGLPSYIRTMVKNFLNDYIRSMSKKPLDNVYINKSTDESYKTEDTFIDTSKNPSIIIEEIEAKRFMEILEKNISEEDFKIICYLTKEKNEKEKMKEKLFKDISKDTLYKRIERLKKKLRKLADDYSFSEGAVELYLKKLLPNKCKKVER